MSVKHRVNFLTVQQNHDLNHACRALALADFHTYHVGSSCKRADYHDVDLRCILFDDEFAAMALDKPDRLAFLNAAISFWLAQRTGLPIDFQFQQMTEANQKYPGCRNYVGMIIDRAAALTAHVPG